jgi:hypothetical protein
VRNIADRIVFFSYFYPVKITPGHGNNGSDERSCKAPGSAEEASLTLKASWNIYDRKKS